MNKQRREDESIRIAMEGGLKEGQEGSERDAT